MAHVKAVHLARKQFKALAPRKDGQPFIVQMRGSPDFKEWLEGAAAADRSSVAVFLERAAIHYAQSIGYKKPAPER